jgi:hypothetical protein
MKARVLLGSLVCAVVALAQQEQKQVRLSGVVSVRVFSGRPNYESVQKGDEVERAWILTVTTEQKKEDFQLVVQDRSDAKFAALRRSLGKNIAIEGIMWEAQTGHHHTPFLITVRAIDEKPQAARPTAANGGGGS